MDSRGQHLILGAVAVAATNNSAFFLKAFQVKVANHKQAAPADQFLLVDPGGSWAAPFSRFFCCLLELV